MGQKDLGFAKKTEIGKKSLDVHMQDALKLDESESLSESEDESMGRSKRRRKLEETDEDPMMVQEDSPKQAPAATVEIEEDTKAMTDLKPAAPGKKWVKVKKTRMSMTNGYMEAEDYWSMEEQEDVLKAPQQPFKQVVPPQQAQKKAPAT